ncbi:flagellar hook-associated protein 3 (HAP3) [Alkalihalophilus pseudofirmus OF4]|uniref:Flagellar hook-associated protein 3 (HAP3) n=1 Tax=Alkalihalophilus pseudofirmus (strain ATCC BAA-2126 / JCM 17055 / OF4) TaxID=398511 RepID=D3FYG9_ALKPO|nr:flagellar hook-associated protein FlgL [Alkalihalophilus pseudofirmus]ADC49192.1 flagellar hook-associated protein 3 (HAP3) [Alkalihalophilus pseudofirmus OF4]
MRVTQSMLANNALRNISSGYANLAQIQDRLATGKKFTRASQDPVVAMNGMRYRTQVTEVTQFKRNLAEMYNFMESSDSALGEVNQALQRIRELTVQASNDTYNSNDRKNIIQEIQQLSEHLASIGNTKVNNKYLFNGTNTSKQPIDLSKLPNYLNRPQFVGVSDTPNPMPYQNLGSYDVESTFTGLSFDADQLRETFNLENVEDLEGKTLRIGPFEGGGTVEVTLAAVGDGVYKVPLTTQQHNYLEGNNEVDVQLFEIEPLDGETVQFTDTNGELKFQEPQNISLTIPASTLQASANDVVTVNIPGHDPIQLPYRSATGSFEVSGLNGYSLEEIQNATVEVNGQTVETRIEIELSDLEPPYQAEDYFATLMFNNKEYRFVYDEATGKYVNQQPIYAPIEEIEAAIKAVDKQNNNRFFNVNVIPSKSPVSGNNETIEIELLKGVTIASNVNTQNVISAELFAIIKEITDELELLMDDMEHSSGSKINGYLDRLDKCMDDVLSARANLGARINRVEMIENRVLEQEVIAKRIMSENEDADMEQVIIDLTTQESVHRAAMAVGARIIQPSLLDFLR